MERTVCLHGDRARTVTVCYLLGMARNERLSDYILRPLAQDPAPEPGAGGRAVRPPAVRGPLQSGRPPARRPWTTVVERPDAWAAAPCSSPGEPDALTLPVPTEEKRAVGEPANEPALKGLPGVLCGVHPHQHRHGPPAPEGPRAEDPGAYCGAAVPHPGGCALSGGDRRPGHGGPGGGAAGATSTSTGWRRRATWRSTSPTQPAPPSP